jgi:predicted metalloprotease with PDZ domain
MQSALAVVLLLVWGFGDVASQLPPGTTSAPISDVRYEVTVDSPATVNRQLGVTMTFSSRGEAPVVLAIAAWSPGHYRILRFARRVSRFAVQGDGQPVNWQKLDYQTWQIAPHAGRLRVSFAYLADTVDRAVAWTRPGFAFFNGTNVFLYPVGRGFDWPATVTVRTEPSWRIVTGLASGAEPRTFAATNFHDLTDMPFFVGRFDLDSASIAERWIRLAWYPAGTLTPARRDRTFGWLRRIIPAEVAVFRDAPYRDYTIFQLSDTVVDAGGLEHQSSQMDEITTAQLDAPGLQGLYAHELFHAWNVKRLRPEDLVPYRYDEPQPTRWLWVSEGITDYYGSLAQVRGGITDSAGFYDDMANAAAYVLASPPAALSDASLSAWIGPLDGTDGLYYPKGKIAGFLLDVMIRDASDNRHSLDDVMRGLYDATWRQGRGFTAEDWWSGVELAAGSGDDRFREFARRYVDGRETLPFGAVLPLVGLRLTVDTVREPRFGISVQPDSGVALVTAVTPDGPAAAAGLLPGDRIVSIGGLPVSDGASWDALRGHYSGTAVTALLAVVRRAGVERSIPMSVRLVPRQVVRVVPDPAATAKAIRIRHGIVTGSVH